MTAGWRDQLTLKENTAASLRGALLEPLHDEYFQRMHYATGRFAAYPGTFVQGIGIVQTLMENDPQERFAAEILEMELLSETFAKLLQGAPLIPEEHAALAFAPEFLGHLSDVFEANLADAEYTRKMQQSAAIMLCLFSSTLKPLCGWSQLVAESANDNARRQTFHTV